MLIRLLLVCAVSLWGTSVFALDESLFEDEEDGHREYRAPPGSEWKELDARLPELPRSRNLIELDVSEYGFPFAVFVDKKSVSIAEDRVVRYTVVLRSRSGAENFSYEGILCKGRKVKRYGYASAGGDELVAARNAEWRYIRKRRQDAYRNILVDEVFCPLPMGDPVRGIINKLKAASVSSRGVIEVDE